MALTAAEKKKRHDIITMIEQLGSDGFQADEDVIFGGDKLQIPSFLSWDDLIVLATRKKREAEQEIDFSRQYQYRPWDVAFGAFNALKRKFGTVSVTGTEGFFGPNPPQMIDVQTGVDEHETIPWGTFSVPYKPQVELTFGSTKHPDFGTVGTVTVSGPKAEIRFMRGILVVIDDELRQNSIYRGKAIDGAEMPGFVDLSTFDHTRIVYSGSVERKLNANVLNILRKHDRLPENVSFKRSILMHGPYGTGKTEFGRRVAQVATENGVTFIWVRAGRDSLDDAMQTAQLYQPAVVFVEDLDTEADPNAHGRYGISTLLDKFDGLGAKGAGIMVVATTNHPERIQAGMVRPGRLDVVIEIGELDQNGIQRLIELNNPAAATLSPEIDWQKVHQAMSGYTPAFVKEAVVRAYLYADNDNGDGRLVLTTSELVEAADDLRAQKRMQDGAPVRSEKRDLADALQGIVEHGTSKVVAYGARSAYGDELAEQQTNGHKQ